MLVRTLKLHLLSPCSRKPSFRMQLTSDSQANFLVKERRVRLSLVAQTRIDSFAGCFGCRRRRRMSSRCKKTLFHCVFKPSVTNCCC